MVAYHVAALFPLSSGVCVCVCACARIGEENDTDAGVCKISVHYTYTIFSTFGSFWLPLAVIVVVYGRIFWIAQRRLRRRIRQRLNVLPPLPVHISAACQSPSPPGPGPPCPLSAEQILPEGGDDRGRTDGDDDAGSTPLAMLSVPALQTTAADNAAAATPSSSGVVAAASYKPETEFIQAAVTSLSGPADMAAISGIGGVMGSTQHRTRSSRIDVMRNHLVSYRKCQYKRMRNSARMLGLIIGAFVLCWLPFFLLATAVPFCAAACQVPAVVSSVSLWLGYCNSLLNPVIYAIWDRNFRYCFRRLATCDLRSRSGGIAASTAARGLPGAALALRRTEPI